MYVCVCMNMGILVEIFICVPTDTCMYCENVIYKNAENVKKM